MTEPVMASGGVVFRQSADGYEVLLVHRPTYDDWSFPKGKDDPGETPHEAAIREVEEETGYRCRIVAPLGAMEYDTPFGVHKQVRYFAMKPLDYTVFEPNEEVDEVRWMGVERAVDLLSYDRDRALLTVSDFGRLSTTGTIYLVRHTAAGSRQKWEGDDTLRPLTDKGWRQAEAIADMLAESRPDRILSSPYVRCVQTVEPLAGRVGVKVEEHHALAEGADPGFGLALLNELAGSVSVLSSHGDVIPDLLQHLTRRGMELLSPFEAKKGSIWVVEVEGGAAVRARYVPPPEG